MKVVAVKTLAAFRAATGVDSAVAEDAAEEVGELALGQGNLTEAVKNLSRLATLIWATVIALLGAILFLFRVISDLGAARPGA